MTGMNKTSLLLLAACMLCGTGFGQGIERRRAGLDPRNYPNGTAILNDGELQYLGLSLLRADTIDTVRHTVEYGFSYPDRDEPDPMLLEIGDSLTAFYSRRAMADDSLYTATLRQNRPRRVQTTAPGWRLYGRIGSRSVEQVHRIPFHEETVTVGETLPLEWRIDTLRQTVLGFVCYRATTRYGGREWQAWFAPEIPIPAGPWKLRGLPGLILCAQDAEALLLSLPQHRDSEKTAAEIRMADAPDAPGGVAGVRAADARDPACAVRQPHAHHQPENARPAGRAMASRLPAPRARIRPMRPGTSLFAEYGREIDAYFRPAKPPHRHDRVRRPR